MMYSRVPTVLSVLCVAATTLQSPAAAQVETPAATSRIAQSLTQSTHSELRAAIERYVEDHGNVRRFYRTPMSPTGRRRREVFYEAWQARLASVDFDSLSQDGRIDFLLFRNELAYRVSQLKREAEREAEIAALIPFAPTIVELSEARRELQPIEPKSIAGRLDELAEAVEATQKVVDTAEEPFWTRTTANRAAGRIQSLQRSLAAWYRFYDGYDPLFTWWAKKPYAKVHDALEDYATHLADKVVGKQADPDTIVGDPIGRDALLASLAHEMIPYTPEELVDIAEREFAWCDREMAKATQELGFGDDWRKAQEHVKSLHVEPGEQPQLIAKLAEEAVDFLETRELLTIPPLCKETWRMQMMSAERQKVNPYFTGGEVISVSYPTVDMEHQDKLMSMRGNNIHFSRATVHHELIPGHHLQGFMTSRYRTHRGVFRTPFWIEGWALYWEMLLWDLDFPKSPEDRIGMLFWRKHRCARIIFSLSFHLGKMTASEAIDFLVERVGHERRNATAEVRRSVQGGYSPLYQAAYMLGGLQIRALHKALVGSGTMTNRAFHDAVLRENAIPIEMVRASLTRQPLRRDFKSHWRFAEGE